MATIAISYVATDNGRVFVQTPEDNQWGFSLHRDDQSFPGGIGVGGDWRLVDDDDPHVTDDDRERLQWILDEARGVA